MTSDLHPRPSGQGYAAALGGHLLGIVLGGGAGLLLALNIEGDPNAGMANLGLALLAAAIVVAMALVGASLGCYVVLRWRRYDGAGRTGWWTLGLFLASVLLALVFAPIFFVGLIWSPLLARKLVLRDEERRSRPRSSDV